MDCCTISFRNISWGHSSLAFTGTKNAQKTFFFFFVLRCEFSFSAVGTTGGLDVGMQTGVLWCWFLDPHLFGGLRVRGWYTGIPVGLSAVLLPALVVGGSPDRINTDCRFIVAGCPIFLEGEVRNYSVCAVFCRHILDL
jgi:hypothetical protein